MSAVSGVTWGGGSLGRFPSVQRMVRELPFPLSFGGVVTVARAPSVWLRLHRRELYLFLRYPLGRPDPPGCQRPPLPDSDKVVLVALVFLCWPAAYLFYRYRRAELDRQSGEGISGPGGPAGVD